MIIYKIYSGRKLIYATRSYYDALQVFARTRRPHIKSMEVNTWEL